MSTDADTVIEPATLEYYRQNPVAFADVCLGLRLAATQREILESIAENRRTLVVSGNGVGKSYAVGAALLWWSLTHPDSVSLLTSGSYSMLTDTTWRPMKGLLKKAIHPIAGHTRPLENPPRIEFPEEEWYFKAVSPTNPDGLEGRHNQDCLVVIEEADKPEIGPEHFDSAGSSVTDTGDRFVAVANPPRDETNVVADKMDSDRWHVVQFDSFDSHNVLAARGDVDADAIPGLVTLDLIREDYEDWNRREWPGVEAAREVVGGLDERWYRRRLGVTPPESAAANRPFYLSDVKGAFVRPDDISTPAPPPVGIALDVARKGGDENVLAAVFPETDTSAPTLRILDEWSGLDHNENEARVRQHLGEGWAARFAVDANAEGSGLADRIDGFYPALERYDAGRNAVEEDAFKNCWTEALAHFGEFLESGGIFADRDVREQALAAARAVEYEERYYKSRDATVYQASPKDDVKEVLGHSPDHLDAAAMACWAASDGTVTESGGVTFSTRRGVTTSKSKRSGAPTDRSSHSRRSRPSSNRRRTRR